MQDNKTQAGSHWVDEGPRAPHSSLSSDAESFGRSGLGEETGSANHYSHYMPGTAHLQKPVLPPQRTAHTVASVAFAASRHMRLWWIGAPDSGTTTLLRCLAGRQPKGRVEGSILIDGRPPDRKIRRIIAFVPKEDVNISLMTVRETLKFSASAVGYQCTAPAKVRGQRVQAWLQLLGLRHVSDVIVGDAVTRGISGGERRRVSIGTETVAGHRLIIADSPTNGLDRSCLQRADKDHLRGLADAGHNGFMASVRQPSAKLLSLFDTISDVPRDLRFWGPISEALPFLSRLGFEKPPVKISARLLGGNDR